MTVLYERFVLFSQQQEKFLSARHSKKRVKTFVTPGLASAHALSQPNPGDLVIYIVTSLTSHPRSAKAFVDAQPYCASILDIVKEANGS